MQQFIDQYITLTKNKQERQKNISGLNFGNPQHRLQGLINEIQEVSDELKLNNQVYLQDELGDIFWNYMNFLTLLESQGYISDINTVLQQSFEKFSERTNAVLDKKDKLSSDLARDKVKKEQKQRLQNEHNNIYQ